VAARGDGGVDAERGMGGEGKTLGLPPYKEPAIFFFFSQFSFGFPFVEFCSPRHLKVLNSGLTKNLEIDSSFFRIFYFKIFKLIGRFTENRSGPVSLVFVKTDRFFNPCLQHLMP
jgi:hypothetical protein